MKFKSPKLHVGLAVFWAVAFIPIAIFWPESVLLVLFISCYANFVGHISSYEAAASAGVDDVTHARLRAIAEGLADIMQVLPDLIPEGEARNRIVTKLNHDSRELRHVVGLEDDSQQD